MKKHPNLVVNGLVLIVAIGLGLVIYLAYRYRNQTGSNYLTTPTPQSSWQVVLHTIQMFF